MTVAHLFLHFIYFITFISNHSKVFGEHCRLPTNEAGSCIPLMQCEALKKLIPLARQSNYYRTYLRQTQCKITNVPWVCCPIKEDREVESRTDFSSQNELPMPEEGICGRAYAPNGILPNRIVGGEDTYVGEFPWHALLVYNISVDSENYRIGYHCGGSLITPMHVVTAAHCTSYSIIPLTWNLAKVRLGEHDLNTETDCEWSTRNPYCSHPPVDIEIVKIIPHELYNAQQGSPNDIAVLKLAQNVQFNNFVKPICLPVNKIISTDYGSGFIIGFGKTESKNSSETLLKTEINIVNHHDCVRMYAANNRFVDNTQICAIGENSDSCKGDSGGGFMKQDDTSPAWFLIGIISYGSRQCRSSYPGVYVKVDNYIPWIKNKINE